MRARALYEFQASDETELGFAVGDELTVITQDPSGWWQAEMDGKRGMIPGNYVEILEEAQPELVQATLVPEDLLGAAPPADPADDTDPAAAASVAGAAGSGAAAAAASGGAPTAKVGKVGGRVAELMAKFHQVGLTAREKIERVDDRQGITTKIRDFDAKMHISDRAADADQRITRWEKDFKADEKVQRAQAKLMDSARDFGEKHPKLKETTDKFISRTNEVLETVAARTSAFAGKVEETEVFQAMKKSLGRLASKIGAKADAVGGRTAELVAKQEEAAKH